MSAAVVRAVTVLFALQGRSYQGMRLRDVADLVGASPSTTLRDLTVLADAGVVERVPEHDGCWRLSPRIVQIAIAHHAEVTQAEAKLNDFTGRYSRKPQ